MTEPLRILILEDNPTDIELIEFELQEAGIVFISKVVVTEEDFLRELQEFHPDLILSDYDLPKYNGPLALAVAKRRCPDTPFILVTGAVTEDRAIDILTKGAKDYVLKNRLEQRLAPAVRRALAEAEVQRARKKAEEELRDAHRGLEEKVRQRTAALEAKIEEHRRAEDALQQSLRRERDRAEELSVLLEAAPTPVFFAHDPDCRHITGNRAADELLKNPRGGEASLDAPDELKPHHFKAFKDGRELLNEELPAQRAAGGAQVRDFEFKLVFDDGTVRDVLGNASPLLDGEGHSRGSVLVLTDLTQIRKTERELSRERDFSSVVLETAGALIVVLDARGRIMRFNRACSDATGYSAAEVQGRVFWEFLVPPDEREGVMAAWGGLTAGVYPNTHDNHWIAKDGSKRWISWTNSAMVEAGEVRYVIGTGIDITARKQAEEAVAAAHQQLQNVIDNTPSMVYACDLEARFVMANAALAALLKTTPEQILGKRRHEFMPHTDADAHEADDRKVIAAGRAVEFEEYSELHGRSFTWLSTKFPLRDAQGRICAVAGIVTDISARKKAEEALRKSEERFRKFFDLGLIGMAITSPAKGFMEVNEKICEILGYEKSELLRLTWAELTHPEDLSADIAQFKKVLAGEIDGYAIEKRFVRKDGAVIDAVISVKCIRAADGSVDYFLALLQDITDRKGRQTL